MDPSSREQYAVSPDQLDMAPSPFNLKPEVLVAPDATTREIQERLAGRAKFRAA